MLRRRLSVALRRWRRAVLLLRGRASVVAALLLGRRSVVAGALVVGRMRLGRISALRGICSGRRALSLALSLIALLLAILLSVALLLLLVATLLLIASAGACVVVICRHDCD